MNEELIYKYTPWDKFSKDALRKRYFWFSKPKNFNDPFDSNVDRLLVSKLGQEIFNQPRNIPNFTDKTLFDLLKRSTKEFGILCLTKKTKKGSIGDKGYNNLHFWSHYADYHKGIVLGYAEQELKDYYSDKIQCRVDLNSVLYLDTPIAIEEYDFIVRKNEGLKKKMHEIFKNFPKDPKVVDAFYEQFLLVKDKRIWGLENEYRMILAGLALSFLKRFKPFSGLDYDIFDESGNGYKIPFPEKEVLKEVTFGVKFDENNVEQTINVISEKNKNVKFYKSELDFLNSDIIRTEIK